jgi:iron complex transport system substrate-binding protein
MSGREGSVVIPALALAMAVGPGGAFTAGCHAAPATGPSRGPRIVSLHDVTTEIVVALGAVDELVAVAEPIQLPPEARARVARIPRAGGPESIVAARPAVVLGMAVVAQRSPELVSYLRGRGVEVWLGHPATLDEVFAVVTDVGSRVGAVAAAQALSSRLRGMAGEAAPRRTDPARVFVYDCCDPAFTAGRTSVLNDLIARAGGRNIFDDIAADWANVPWEEVIARRPQLIVIHDYQLEGQGDVAEKRRRVNSVPSLRGIPLTVMPLGFSLGGLRSIEGLARLRQAIREIASPG